VTFHANTLQALILELMDFVPDASLMVNPHGRIIAVNAAAERMFGFDRGELQGRSLDSLIPERFRSAHAVQSKSYLSQARHRAMGVGLDLRALRKDQSEFPVEISLGPLATDEGNFVLCTLRDLSQNEEWYRELFEDLAVGVAHSDAEGKLLNANRKFCELSGYTRAEMLTLDIRRLTHPADITKSFAARTRMLAGAGSAYEREVRLIHKGGATIWTRITTSLVRGGRPGQFVSLVQDISLQKAAEEERREANLRFRQVTENIRETFWLTDALHTQVLYVSPGCEAIWGKSAAAMSVTPRSWTHAIHPDDRQRVLAAVQTKQITESYDEEYRIVRPDGTVRWIRDRAFPVRSDDGEIIRIAGVAEDITERKRATDELKESERRFSEILGKVQLVSLILDCNGRIVYCNQYLLTLSGWSYEEVCGKDWFELFIPPEISAEVKNVFASILADVPSAWHHENEIVTRSGERRLVAWNNIALRSLEGEAIGSASIGEDITERKRAEELHARLAAIVESSDDAIVGKTLDGIVTSWNSGAEKLFGYPAAEAIGQSIAMIVPDDRAAEEPQILEQLRHGRRIAHFETVRRRKDGSLIDVSLTISPVHDASGRIVGASKIARDITEHKRTELKIRHLNRVYAVLSSINALIVRVRDRDELFWEACRIAVEVGLFKLAWIGILEPSASRCKVVAWSGHDEDYLRMLPLEFGGVDAGAFEQIDRKVLINNDMAEQPAASLHEESRRRGLRGFVRLPLLINDKPAGVLALYTEQAGFFDDDEMKLLHELAGDIAFALDHLEKATKVDYLAYYDQLSGLANRTLFLERLNQDVHTARIAGEEFSVALVDTERLRAVNDSLGRPAGDELLKRITERLVRSVDRARLARISGSVFAIVLHGLKGGSALELKIEALIREIFSLPFELGASEIRISAKVGAASFPIDGRDAETLLRSAEAALRRAKESGDKYVVHVPEITARSVEKLTMEMKLRRALERDEFVLHYQPKVKLTTRQIVGAEALIRWQTPEGLVPPMQFIPLMEETGLILEAGTWALCKAVADHDLWRRDGLKPPRVAVNVSAIQMRSRDFVHTIATAIRRGAMPPGIDLEITESLLMEDIDGNIRKLQQLRELGIEIAIDDFGVGYSSLSYLAKLPVQTLKIDRSFLAAILDDSDTMLLVQTIISLAHSLKRKVIAEGVESEEQADLLRRLGCDEMQGYLISRPVPFEQMSALLERRRAVEFSATPAGVCGLPKSV
jgi:PAS domain S-box-containing protein/diguanylate cyclase (GGDEF)-like protein